MKDNIILFKHAANMIQLIAGAELRTHKPAIWQTVSLYWQGCKTRRDAAVQVQFSSYIDGNLLHDFCLKELSKEQFSY